MGRTPPRARRRLKPAVVLLVLALLAGLSGSVADAKKAGGAPGQAHGGGNGNGGRGNGGGNGNGGGGQQSGSTDGTRQQSSGDTVTTNSTGGGGKVGGGNGNHGGGGHRGGGNNHGGGGSGSSGSGTGTSTGTSSGTAGATASSPSSSSGSGLIRAAGTGTTGTPTSSPTRLSPSGLRRRETKRHAARRARARTASRRAERRAAERRSRRAHDATQRRGAEIASSAAALTSAAPGAADETAGRTSGNNAGGETATAAPEDSPVMVRTLKSVVEVIPGFVKAVIAALALALLIASAAWFLLARNARFLRRQREKLVGEIGVLQGALLPNVPPELNRLEASVAYRPAEGLAAGGDFYDAFPLDSGRVGIVVGDVAGHGKEALMHTALLRYTMRAYLEAGLEPRAALQVAGRVLDRGFDTLATVVLAVYEPGRNVLRYATAGHPPPVFLGEADHAPVTRASSPPIGAAMPTGLRQTTVSLPAGSAACFFTDGLIEARRDGDLIGRLGLVDIIRELGPHATASQVLDMVAAEADYVGDDMAACMFRVSDGPSAADSPPRVEELEVSADEPVRVVVERFLSACGVADADIARHTGVAERTAARARGAIVTVAFPPSGPRVEIDPANVESITAAHAVRAAG